MCENKISLIGSTGSIGTQTLDVARRLNLRVTALSANSSVRELENQCREFNPVYVCIGDEYYSELKTLLADTDIKIFSGDDGLLELIERDESNTLVNAVLGMKGLKPTLKAASLGKKIAFANKETLVAGGKLVLDAVKKGNSVLLPVDSEHSAIFQCLNCGNKPKKLLLTGSGGPFLGRDKAFLTTVTPEMAVKHPKWKMGKKISVDSATLMNKGLELIEAAFLFDVAPDDIKVLIHPQSIVHSLVEFEDNAVLAQLGMPDMRLCIQYALTYPNRYETSVSALGLVGKKLEFFDPDEETFPLLPLARNAVKKGGNIPAAMNGANEAAVKAFLDHKISFTKLFDLVIGATENASYIASPTLDDILNTDASARDYVKSLISE